MKCGDSFSLQETDLMKVRSNAYGFGKKNPPYRFAIRMTDRRTREYRCWRIA